jgi:hypothetical protein
MIWFLFPAGSAAVQTGSGKKKCTQALKEKAENRQKGMQGRPESPEKAEKRKEEFGVIQEMKKQAFNPYLPLNEYIPDAEPHVFGDRIYIYGSHDKENGETFCMLPYTVWSAPVTDLSDWTCAGVVFDQSEDPLYDEETEMIYTYAPDVVQGNDGRFYMYYCLSGRDGHGGYTNPISVAVSDRPDGPFRYLGVVHDKNNLPLMRYVCFDPAVINDNGVIRLYYGTYYRSHEKMPARLRERIESPMFGRTPDEIRNAVGWTSEDGRVFSGGIAGAIHVELEDDMLTAKTLPMRINDEEFCRSGHSFFEGSSIRRICFMPDGTAVEAGQIGGSVDGTNSLYYFIYSSEWNDELCYATSRYPDRDFKFRGTIVSTGDVGYMGRKQKDRLNHTGTTHGSIECINGQWYVFYHRLTNQSDYCRQGCAEPIEIERDGTIRQVEVTSCGLHDGALDGALEGAVTYPAAICCNLTNGRMRHGSNSGKPYAAPKIMCRAADDIEGKEETGTENVHGAYGDGFERFVGQITNGTLIGYKYFQFNEGDITLTVRMRGHGGGQLYVTTEGDGEAQEVIDLSDSGFWKKYTVSWEQKAGVAPLYFMYAGHGNYEILEFTLS